MRKQLLYAVYRTNQRPIPSKHFINNALCSNPVNEGATVGHWMINRVTKLESSREGLQHALQGRPYADATDAAALGPAPLGASAPWCLGRLFIFASYTLKIQ